MVDNKYLDTYKQARFLISGSHRPVTSSLRGSSVLLHGPIHSIRLWALINSSVILQYGTSLAFLSILSFWFWFYVIVPIHNCLPEFFIWFEFSVSRGMLPNIIQFAQFFPYSSWIGIYFLRFFQRLHGFIKITIFQASLFSCDIRIYSWSPSFVLLCNSLYLTTLFLLFLDFSLQVQG